MRSPDPTYTFPYVSFVAVFCSPERTETHDAKGKTQPKNNQKREVDNVMKNILRLIVAGVIAAGLFVVSAQATTQTYTSSGYTGYYTWNFSVPSTASVTSSVYFSAGSGSAGGGSNTVSLNGTSILIVAGGVNGPGTFSKTDSKTNLAADTYTVVHSFSGTYPPGTFYASFSTTFSW